MRWLRTVSSRTPNTSRSWWARCTARKRRTATLPLSTGPGWISSSAARRWSSRTATTAAALAGPTPGVAPSERASWRSRPSTPPWDSRSRSPSDTASHRPSPVRSSRATSSASRSARGPCRMSRSRGCSRLRAGKAVTTLAAGVARRSRARALAGTVLRGAERRPLRRSRGMAAVAVPSWTCCPSRTGGDMSVSAPDGTDSCDALAGTGRWCDVMALLLDGSTAGFATSSARPNGRAPGRRRRRRPAWPCARTDGGRPSCGDRAVCKSHGVDRAPARRCARGDGPRRCPACPRHLSAPPSGRRTATGASPAPPVSPRAAPPGRRPPPERLLAQMAEPCRLHRPARGDSPLRQGRGPPCRAESRRHGRGDALRVSGARQTPAIVTRLGRDPVGGSGRRRRLERGPP